MGPEGFRKPWKAQTGQHEGHREQKGRVSPGVLAEGSAITPAGFTPFFGKLRFRVHPDPSWPFFLLSPAPGKPQNSQAPPACPPHCRRRGLTGLSLHSPSQTSQGHQKPADVCPPLSMRVTQAFCDFSHITHTCSHGHRHTQTCTHTHTPLITNTYTSRPGDTSAEA